MQKKNKLSVASLGSGSKGNATLISNQETTILIDCGFSLKETQKRLAKLGIEAESIKAILVTHEHQDHIKGVGALSRKFNIPVYASRGTFLSEKCGEIAQTEYIQGFSDFKIGDLGITPLSVPHDAREPCQFVIEHQGSKIAVLTDLGSFTPAILKQLSSCDGLVLEFNYDYQMLWDGEYPYSLKQRVAGNYGHLSNDQSISLLQQLELSKTQWIVASHLSEKNNCPTKVRELLVGELESLKQKNAKQKNIEVVIAKQNEGYAWRGVV